MTVTLETISNQALALSSQDRLELAKQLLDSVEPVTNENAEQGWEAEIETRISEVDAGTAKGRSWDAIKRDFDKRYGE